MRQTLCDVCASVIPNPDEAFLIKTVTQTPRFEATYELCDDCKAKFHKFLKEKGGCDAL